MALRERTRHSDPAIRQPAHIKERKVGEVSLPWTALAMALACAGYFVLRFGGLWMENDTSVFSRTAARTLQEGTIFFRDQYVHGFGYSAWLALLSALTSIPPPILDTAILPYIGALFLVLPAYLAYR